jgi:hypothetical protein
VSRDRIHHSVESLSHLRVFPSLDFSLRSSVILFLQPSLHSGFYFQQEVADTVKTDRVGYFACEWM